MENQISNEVKYCPYCGNKNKKENKFCIICGGSLVPTSEPQTQNNQTAFPESIPAQYHIEQEETKENKKQKFGFPTVAGILGILGFCRSLLILAIAVMLLFFYIFIPSYRNAILFIVNGIGKLIIGFFVIVLALYGACFLLFAF